MLTMQVIRPPATLAPSSTREGSAWFFSVSTAPYYSGGHVPVTLAVIVSLAEFWVRIRGASRHCGRLLLVTPHPWGDRRDQCEVEHFFCLATVNVVYC